MKLSVFLTITGLLALAFGLSFLFAPGATLAPYGVTTDATGIYMSRYFGAALVQLGLVIFLARRVGDSAAQRAIVLGSSIGSLAGLGVALSAQLSRAVNALGWSTVAIYLFLLLGYSYFQFMRPRAGVPGHAP
jgi:hypothetical protein